MEDGIQDEKGLDVAGLCEALSSSSTQRRGAGLAILHQQAKDSGMRL